MTEAVIKCWGSAPKEMYAASTEPETVANPDTIIECISDSVKELMYGLMISGPSDIPKKMFAAAFTLSQTVVPRID